MQMKNNHGDPWKNLEHEEFGENKPMRDLWPAAPVCLRQASKAVRKQGLLPGVEAAPIPELAVHRPHEATVQRRFRVCGAHLPLWKRPFRLDNGRRVLPEVRRPGTAVLAGTMGPGRIGCETGLHLHPDLQAITRIQTVALRLNQTFCPPDGVLMKF